MFFGWGLFGWYSGAGTAVVPDVNGDAQVAEVWEGVSYVRVTAGDAFESV